ncbi:MAG: DUF4430 domain-containing protein [Candidatus Lokiarchaeota archaeon]|nr:DUF4430 domain-containing protein [Candidatus Lokiarchaeota archaeon]
MKNIKKITYFIAALIFVQLLYSGSIPLVKAQVDISNSYYQNLEYNNPYVYEVIQFGDSTGWYNFSEWSNSYEGDWKTDATGQILVKLTGFYDKDPNDWGNVFGDPIPWYDIGIYENNLGVLKMNFTLSNRSNSEVARALTLGYNSFQPGFLIPNENLTNVKELALNQSDPGGLYDIVGDLDVEESYNFLSIGFEQNGGGQKTSLIYDKSTGLLVWAKTSIFGYLLEIKSLNFTLDYFSGFEYNVLQFGGAVGWYNFTQWPADSYEGDWKTNTNGQILINFTGFYDKDPNDWGNIIDDPIPWFDIEIVENKSGILTTNFTLSNRSNSELGWAFTLGYNNFQSGILIQIIDNLTRVKKLAFQEASGFVNGLVSVEETQLTIKISFDQVGGGQKTKMIYEKRTGLLLWANTSIGSYLLEMAIDKYIPWESTGEEIRPPTNYFLKFLPYIVIASICILIMAASLIVSRFKTGLKKFNKYILIVILATASFASFFVFTSSIEVGEVNEPVREIQDITLIVDYGNGTVKTWENIELSDYNTTAFDTLIKWCETEITDYGDMGIIVESVDGIEGNWRYSINDEFPGVSANKYNLKNGDIVKWIFG